MKIRPLCDYVVIKPLEAEETTKSGIIIPDTADKEKPQQGKIVAVAEDNTEVKIDDTVIYGRYSGEDVKLDGEEYKIVEMKSIRAVVE